MNLDNELDIMEEFPETEAEQIDEETEIQDVEDDMDEILGADAMESDQEIAYDSFITDNEEDYDGYDSSAVGKEEAELELENELNSEGYHIADANDLEGELLEMEIAEGDIYAFLVDEDDNEIGFVLIDEDGNEQEYYYVDIDDYEVVDEEGNHGVTVERASDGMDFDLGITRESIAETTADLGAIYADGKEIVTELKDTIADIADTFKTKK